MRCGTQDSRGENKQTKKLCNWTAHERCKAKISFLLHLQHEKKRGMVRQKKSYVSALIWLAFSSRKIFPLPKLLLTLTCQKTASFPPTWPAPFYTELTLLPQICTALADSDQSPWSLCKALAVPWTPHAWPTRKQMEKMLHFSGTDWNTQYYHSWCYSRNKQCCYTFTS